MRLKRENHHSKIKEAENPESQPENKRDRLTTLSVINAAKTECLVSQKRGEKILEVSL